MASQDTESIKYGDANFRALMTEYKALSTFAEVAAWDSRAQAEVETLATVLQKLEAGIARQTEALEQVRTTHEEKSFLSRMVSGRKAEKEIAQLIDQFQKHKATLEALAAQMQEAIDFSPDSPEEQKALLKELRQRKKELQLQKRELAASMKSIRADARQQSVHAGRTFLGIYDRRLGERERRQIRYAKEAALRPQEDAKAAVERQLLQVDRDILWAERFK